jgi:protein-arginine kinase activator protein McsA
MPQRARIERLKSEQERFVKDEAFERAAAVRDEIKRWAAVEVCA